MILAGALTLAGITGATAFIPETKVSRAAQEQSFTKFYSLQTGGSSEQEPVFLQKGQELTIQPNSKTPSYSVYDSNHNLIGRYSDGYGRIFTAKQMEICMFNFMHLTFTIVLLVFLLLILFNRKEVLYRTPFISLPNSLLQIHLLLLICLYSIHIPHLLLK